MKFSTIDPYPLLQPDAQSYAEAQAHAHLVDQWLGLPIELIESQLFAPANDQIQTWVGLKPQALLTPYTEIRSMLERLKPQTGDTFVDLGCAYARMAFVQAAHYPQTRFVGYELVEPRLQAARDRLAQHAPAEFSYVLECRDIAGPDFALPDAQAYFLYDFGTRQQISTILERLRSLAARFSIRVVGRGRRTRDLIEQEHPWLSQVHRPEHAGHFSIYFS